jgi:hypothetical protein
MLKTNPNQTRAHLANERNFLFCIRTAVSLMGFGILIVKLHFSPDSVPHGLGVGAGFRRLFSSPAVPAKPDLQTRHSLSNAMPASGSQL